jgi:hypothetical protein
MEQYQEIISLLALTLGVGWASGINLYATIATLGLMGATGNMDLPPGLETLQDPMVIAAAGLMFGVEFFADKIPGVDSGWDAIHTFIRIPAGVILAAGAVGDIGPGAELAAAIVGGTLSATSHAAKSGTRALINTSPEPFTNWTASLVEDVAVIGGVYTAIQHPALFLVLLVVFIIFVIWFLPIVWRAVKRLFRVLLRLFGVKDEPPLERELPVDRSGKNSVPPPSGRPLDTK